MKNTLLVSLLCIALTACGGGGGSSAPVSNPVTPVTPVTPPTTPPVTPPVVPVVPPVVPVTPTVANSIPLSVNTGINGNYLNGLFGSVTICQPSTASSGVAANCQTINNILFDTGSVGLRIAANALPAGFNLPTALDQSGNKIAECTHFADGVTWGTVNRADVKLGGEIATNIPVQIVGENVVPVPASCSGSGKTMDTAQAIGANGILGIGLFKQDCGNGCALSATYNIYYTCPATGCVSTKMPTASQVANPIAQFPQDSNGNIIALNAIPDTGTNNVSGTLFFGVGTQSNNTFNNLNVIQTDGRGMFGITYNNKNYPDSFIDSGTSIYSLYDTTIPTCTTGYASGLYCPTSQLILPMTVVSPNRIVFDIKIGNAGQLYNSGNFAFNNLGIPNTNLSSTNIDLGLTFFYGKNIVTGMEGTTSNLGSGTYFAF